MRAAKTVMCKVKGGVCYWPTSESAWRIVHDVMREFPEARVVQYELGHAIQVRKSGDYLGPNFRPSMENRMEAFFAD